MNFGPLGDGGSEGAISGGIRGRNDVFGVFGTVLSNVLQNLAVHVLPALITGELILFVDVSLYFLWLLNLATVATLVEDCSVPHAFLVVGMVIFEK